MFATSENRVSFPFLSFVCLNGRKVVRMCANRQIAVVVLAVCAWVGMACTGFADLILASGDPIYGVYNTVAGGDSTAAIEDGANPGPGHYAPEQSSAKAIDGLLSTKYCIYNTDYNSSPDVVKTGLYVTPASGLSIVTSIQFATANDANGRDPLTITLEGSNSSGDLTLGSAWTSIYSGTAGLDTDPGRDAWGAEQAISNTEAYKSYRLLVASIRDVDGVLTQFDEVKLSGSLVPEPGTLALLATGLIGLLAYAWRKRK